MPKLNEKQTKTAADLIQTFAACSNFPKAPAGVKALAEALERASRDFGIEPERITQACADISAYCPVPREIRNIAIGIRDEIRRKRETNRDAEWRLIYGAPDADWPAELMGILAGAARPEEKRACHIRAIRDMLFYTEGDGRGTGDRAFWDGNESNPGARNLDLATWPELVEAIRQTFTWRTERELAQPNPEVRV